MKWKIKPIYLPWYGALVQTLQYAHAGWTYLDLPGIFIVGSMGALISLVVAYAAARINDVAKDRKNSSWFFFALLLFVSPIFIGIAMNKAITPVISDDWPRWIVSAIWGLIPDGSVALSGVITGGSLVELRTSGKKTGTSSGTRQKATGRTGHQSRTSPNTSRSQAMRKIVQCPYCLDNMTQAQLNNHKTRCKIAQGVFTRGGGSK